MNSQEEESLFEKICKAVRSLCLLMGEMDYQMEFEKKRNDRSVAIPACMEEDMCTRMYGPVDRINDNFFEYFTYGEWTDCEVES